MQRGLACDGSAVADELGERAMAHASFLLRGVRMGSGELGVRETVQVKGGRF
jgi:hypothetical protein